jgi:uncharacterized protein (TIGR02118 family)
MGIRLHVHFGTPTDPDEFERYYVETHAPLGRALPGLRSYEYGRVKSSLDGSPTDTFWIATLTFDDADAMQAALASREGAATNADMANFVTGPVTVLVSDVL